MDSPRHRKIDLQSPADLSHINANIRGLARQKLDLHLPRQDQSQQQPATTTAQKRGTKRARSEVDNEKDGEDLLRTQVDAHLTTFVAHLLQGIRHNSALNGVPLVEPSPSSQEHLLDPEANLEQEQQQHEEDPQQEETEPFNEKLRQRVASAVARRDALVAKTSRHRRETGARAAREWERRWEREGGGDLPVDYSTVPVDNSGDGGKHVERQVDGSEEGGKAEMRLRHTRQDELERSWARACEGLGELGKGLPETRARLERCVEVVGYLGGSGSEKQSREV